VGLERHKYRVSEKNQTRGKGSHDIPSRESRFGLRGCFHSKRRLDRKLKTTKCQGKKREPVGSVKKRGIQLGTNLNLTEDPAGYGGFREKKRAGDALTLDHRQEKESTRENPVSLRSSVKRTV